MNIKSLTFKNIISTESGERYYDLTAPAFLYKPELGIKGIHYVLPDQEGRLDKISEIYFGSSEFIDAICIVNNIFNPFSVKEGEVLVIPNLTQESLVYTKPKTILKKEPTLSQYINATNQVDENRLKRLSDKANNKKSPASLPLPPNMLNVNQQSKEFVDGKIILGANLNNK